MNEEKEGRGEEKALVSFLPNTNIWNTVIPDNVFFFASHGDLPCSNITLIQPSHLFQCFVILPHHFPHTVCLASVFSPRARKSGSIAAVNKGWLSP